MNLKQMNKICTVNMLREENIKEYVSQCIQEQKNIKMLIYILHLHLIQHKMSALLYNATCSENDTFGA